MRLQEKTNANCASSLTHPTSDKHDVLLDQLIAALVETSNGAADELLLEALRLGNPQEKTLAMNALLSVKPSAG